MITFLLMYFGNQFVISEIVIANVTAVFEKFIKMVFSDEDKILIKSLRSLKGCMQQKTL